MRSENFTARSISCFQCEEGKGQTIFSDAKTPDLGLRITKSGNKSYIFEIKLHSKTLRITIGSIQAWPLSKAQAEASRLKVIIDQGIDPREIEAKKKAALFGKKQKETLECLTFKETWLSYIDERKPFWSVSHYKDHLASAVL